MDRFPNSFSPAERRRPDFGHDDFPNKWQRIGPSPSDMRFNEGRSDEQFLERSRSFASFQNDRTPRDLRSDPSRGIVDMNPLASGRGDTFAARSDIEAELFRRNLQSDVHRPFPEGMPQSLFDQIPSSGDEMQDALRRMEYFRQRESGQDLVPFRNDGPDINLDRPSHHRDSHDGSHFGELVPFGNGNAIDRPPEDRDSPQRDKRNGITNFGELVPFGSNRGIVRRNDNGSELPLDRASQRRDSFRGGREGSHFSEPIPPDVSLPFASPLRRQSRPMGGELSDNVAPALLDSPNPVAGQSNEPSFWRGTRADLWLNLFRSVLDLEMAALTPNRVKTHQFPEIILEIIRYWFENLKHRPEQSLQDHLLQLDVDTCERCFHLHPKTEKCFCPCWLKIIILLTNDVDKVRDSVLVIDRRREAEAERERLEANYLKEEEAEREQLRLREKEKRREEEKRQREEEKRQREEEKTRRREEEKRQREEEKRQREEEKRQRSEDAERERIRRLEEDRLRLQDDIQRKQAELERLRLQEEEKLRLQEEEKIRRDEEEKNLRRSYENEEIRRKESERARRKESGRDRRAAEEESDGIDHRYRKASRAHPLEPEARLSEYEKILGGAIPPPSSKENLREGRHRSEKRSLSGGRDRQPQSTSDEVDALSAEPVGASFHSKDRYRPKGSTSERSQPSGTDADLHPGEDLFADQWGKEKSRHSAKTSAVAKIPCKEPFFVSLLKLDPTLDPIGILESRSCHSCLRLVGDDELHDEAGCSNDDRLCLTCFHAHPATVPCSCECQQALLRETVPNFDHDAVVKWNLESRRAAASTQPSESVPPFSFATHPPPPFVAFVLKNPTVNIVQFAEEAFCPICLVSTHRMDACKNKYLCAICLHEHHPLAEKECRCRCFKQRLVWQVKRLTVWSEMESFERGRKKKRSILEFLIERDGPIGVTETGEVTVNHVIPKFVYDVTRRYKDTNANIVLLVKPFKEKFLQSTDTCLVCLMTGHVSKECPNGFICLNCFHNHKMSEACKCFCYLTTLSKDTKLFGGGTREVKRMQDLQHIEVGRKLLLEKHVFEVEECEKGKVTDTSSAAPAEATVPESSPAPTSDTSTATKSPEREPPAPPDAVLNFHFPQFGDCKMPMANKEPVASLKMEFLTLLQQKDCPIPEGEAIFYRLKGKKGQKEMLVDGKLISDYNFPNEPINLKVKFQDDVLRYQNDKARNVHLVHPLPDFLKDFVLSESKKSLKATLDKNCLNCLDKKHKFSDCKEKFFCLSCFHSHKVQYACECKCVINHVAKVADADRFDLKQSEKWNCKRIKRMIESDKSQKPDTVSSAPIDAAENSAETTSEAPSAMPLSAPTSEIVVVTSEATAITAEPVAPTTSDTVTRTVVTPTAHGSPVVDADEVDVLEFYVIFASSDQIPCVLSMPTKEPMASVKMEFLTQLQQTTDSIPEGETILYHSQKRLIDGKLISDYFRRSPVRVNVEFRDDVYRFQNDKTRSVVLNHSIPTFLKDFVASGSKKSLKATLDKNCLNCLAEKHQFFECKETFFCLSCFHSHKMAYACACKCVINHVAQVVDADRFDLRQLEKWHCKRIKRMAQIGSE